MLAIHTDPQPKHTTTGRQIRGSILLLAGRLIALAVNFAVQVVIVRYLSKSDYGAFAYALTVASLGSSVALLGLDKAVTVFVTVYHERRDYDRLFGTIAIVMGTTMSLGLAVVLLVLAMHGLIGDWFALDQQAMMLVLILIALVPVQVLDSLIGSMFAVLGRPRAIFFRGFVLAPGLRLGVVILLILKRSDVYFLAAGYLGAAIVGLAICTLVLFRLLRGKDLLRRFKPKAISMPVRKVFGFTVPLLVSDLRFMLGTSAAVLMLQHFRGAVEVATFRAILPLAMLNLLVFESFKHLFTPLVARMFARKDHSGINDLYCQSAVWIAVISFPILVMTFTFARSLIILLYGDRYAQAALILALLSLCYYFSAALGFNGLTLRVFGKARRITLTVDLLGAITSLGVSLLLIPRYGALGAAISISGTLIALNVLYQIGLRKGVGIKLSEWRWLKVYLVLMLGSLGSLLVQALTSSYIHISVALAALVFLLVVKITFSSLDVGNTFPELLRFRLMRRLFGSRKDGLITVTCAE